MTIPRVWISEIEFSDESKVSFSKNDITIIVGPNNSGKSGTLREAAYFIRHNGGGGRIIKTLRISKEGNQEQLIEFIDSNSRKSPGANLTTIYQGYQFQLESANAINLWNYNRGLDGLTSLFLSVLDTQERLNAANPAASIRLTIDPVQHPIHFLQRDDSIEFRFSDYFKQAFGTDLIVHRSAGTEVPLYVGDRPKIKEGEDRTSVGYLFDLESLDLLHQQGDGMRSFVGVLLKSFLSNHSMIFIDEPEAFLHPPQARLLGRMLAQNLPSQRQLFIATHSEDFIKGLLDTDAENLKIIRIQRSANVNKVSVLDNEDIKAIWKDSLLRHSNILSGLFHKQVIICESDSDSRFYSAILSALEGNSISISHDVLFIQTGGKHRIPTAVKALKKLNVPIKVVADFDVLNDESPLKEIFQDLGGIWKDVEVDWQLVKREIESRKPELEIKELRKEFDKIFDDVKGDVFPKEAILKVKNHLRKASAWSYAKEVGRTFIPKGNAIQAFDRIQVKFQEKGLFILEVGEVESFAKSVPNHGPKWVSGVLEKNLREDHELEAARAFVSLLVK